MAETIMKGTRSVKGEPCIFCDAPGSNAGEHVIPAWLNRWMDRTWGGPYPVYRNGEPLRRRNGDIWTQDKPITYKAPCCEVHNQILSERFEVDQPDVEAFLEARPYDAAKVGLWWLKTLLLFVHPATVETSSTSEMITHPPLSEDVDLYSWMIDGSEPPEWLHVFCALPRAPESGRPTRDVMKSVWLRSWSFEGQTFEPALRSPGIANVQFQLLYAPGLKIEHPFMAAHKLWPAVGEEFVNRGVLSDEEAEEWRNSFFASGGLMLRFGEEDQSPLEDPLTLPSPGVDPWCADRRIKGVVG